MVIQKDFLNHFPLVCGFFVPGFSNTIKLLLRRMPTLAAGIPTFIVGTLVLQQFYSASLISWARFMCVISRCLGAGLAGVGFIMGFIKIPQSK